MSARRTQNADFTCVITDTRFHETYSAEVRIAKKRPIRTSLQAGRIDLADIYVTPVSGQLEDVHNHFVLYDSTGRGLYIVRDRYDREIRRVECSTWDLGQSFALQVLEHLKQFS
ncbi:MAG: hypothetical protein NEA02_14910 [Thermoanaerobaculia bacterium]|nr:hypothetical protein [Thermoanaerobaculia bacterium]